MNENKARIAILDAFRAIAILMVVFFHFYSRWTNPLSPENYYPYGNKFSGYFHYGYFGVQFFFVISGFVIFYTLEKSANLGDFWIKRIIRLFPPILICSIITYVFITLVSAPNEFTLFRPKTALDFFPSLTFTPPSFWIKLFGNADIEYINLSYWSLWVEISFYLLSSLIFFCNKEKFVRNWMLFLIPVTLLKIIGAQNDFGNIHYVSFILRRIAGFADVFNFCRYSAYFSLGILFYILFHHRKVSTQSFVFCAFYLLVETYYLNSNVLRLMLLAVIILFTLFIYKPAFVSFLNNAFLTRIAIISYSLYLIHESIGVVLINKSAAIIKSPVLQAIIPVLLVIAFIAFAEILYRLYEKPLNTFFRKWLLARSAKKAISLSKEG